MAPGLSEEAQLMLLFLLHFSALHIGLLGDVHFAFVEEEEERAVGRSVGRSMIVQGAT